VSESTGRLNRTLGLPALLFYGVGVIVGAGIYSILGAAAGVAQRGVWLSLLLSSVPAGLAGLCYAELCTRFPRAGGAYVFVREALPRQRWAAFLIGFATALTAATAAATVAVAFGGYLALLVPLPAWLSALLLIAACTALNVIGIRESAWVTIAFTIVEIAGLVLVVGAGLHSGRFGQGLLDFPMAGILPAAAVSFFVFTGFEGLANLAEEAREPERRLPPAILGSLAFTTVAYLLVSISAVALVAPDRLAQSDSPLATAAAAADPSLAAALGWIALFSTANTALITLIVGSRLLYGMAEEGDLPRVLGLTLPQRRTPWVAGLVLGAATLLFLPLGDVAVIGSVSSLATLVIFAAVGLSLMRLRLHERERPPGFRVPLRVGRWPVVPLLLFASIAALAYQFEARVHAATAVSLAVGLAIHAVRSRISARRPG
jgi:amino acid transporter